MASMVLPRVQAMVLCDGVEESEYEAAVYDLTGVRTVIESPFPAVVSQLCVFAQMSGHQGESYCHIEIEHIDANEVIFATVPQPISFETPTAAVAVVFPLANCVFPVPGLYYVQVYNEAKMIGERPLLLRNED